MVTNRGWWAIGRTYDGYSEPFEILGLFVSAAILAYWVRSFRADTDDRRETIVERLVVGGLVLHFLYIIVNHAAVAWDYRCYDSAARNIVAGANPYLDTAYLYPPLLAQCMAGIHAWVESIPAFSYENVTSWWIVFYFYQAAQLVLVFVTAELCFSFGRRLKIPVAWVALLVLALFLVSAPFLRTIRLQQVNILVLLAILYSLVHLRSRPWLCGILMAVAIAVKPQGILFPLMWLLTGHRKAFFGFMAAALVLIFAQAGLGSDWTHWRQFIESTGKIPVYNDYFRNQSLFSFVSSTTKALSLSIDKEYLMLFVRACQLGVLGGFVYRYIEREKLYAKELARTGKDGRDGFELIMRVCGHTADIILLALVVSPMVWEHHYVLALPIVLWLFGLSKGRLPRPAILALALIFIPSTFDVVFLSYHKLAGTILLIVALSPARVFGLFAAHRDGKYAHFAGFSNRDEPSSPRTR